MFEEIGFFKEFYLDGKFIGISNCEKDREVVGYNGRKKETLEKEVVCTNKKIIKANKEYLTIIYPICGKIENQLSNNKKQ